MTLADMVEGNKYLVGDGYGYDEVICLGPPTQEEIEAAFGYSPNGASMKVRFVNEDREDIFFETPECTLYVEPR